MKSTVMPYTILVLAPFTGEREQCWQEKPVAVDSTDPAGTLRSISPKIWLPLPENLCPTGGIELCFEKFKDFTPDGLLGAQPFLRQLVEVGEFHSADKAVQGKTDFLDNILSMVEIPGTSQSVPAKGPRRGHQSEEMLCDILNRIFSHTEFRSMDAAWQGLRLLARHAATGDRIRLEIVPVCLNTLEETLDTQLAHLIVNPPALLVVDLGFTHSTRSLSLLTRLAEFAETLLVPCLAWLQPEFFQVAAWQEIEKLPYLANFLDQDVYAKFRTFQSSSAARWLALFCNRLLLRFPYSRDNRVRQLEFTERELPWIAPVWAAGTLLCQAVHARGWPVGINDQRHLRLRDLALSTLNHSPLEAVLSDTKIEQLHRIGIMPLVAATGTDSAFFSGDTVCSGDVSFSYQALVSRFAQLVMLAFESLDEDIALDRLADQLRSNLLALFIHQGTEPVDGLEVMLGTPNKEKKIPVQVRWTPPRHILPSGRELHLELLW